MFYLNSLYSTVLFSIYAFTMVPMASAGSDPDIRFRPDPDPLVRGMNPLIRIRTDMSRIGSTGMYVGTSIFSMKYLHTVSKKVPHSHLYQPR